MSDNGEIARQVAGEIVDALARRLTHPLPGEAVKLEHEKLSNSEKAVISVITAIVIAMLGWTVQTTNDTSRRVAVIESKMGDLRETTADRFTRSEHDNYAQEIDRRLTRVEQKAGFAP